MQVIVRLTGRDSGRKELGTTHPGVLLENLLVLACLVIALLSNCPAQSLHGRSGAKSALEPMTVMTWNLEWFYDDEAGDNYSELGKEKDGTKSSGMGLAT